MIWDGPLLFSALAVTLLNTEVFSASILFLFAGGNLSHKIGVWSFVSGLADRGHNVTFISSSKKQPVPNPKVNDITPKVLQEFTAQMYKADRLKDRVEGTQWDASTGVYEEYALHISSLFLNVTQSDPALRVILEQKGHFDLVVINSLFGEVGFLLAHHLGAKYIVFDSTMFLPWYHGVYGVPMEPSWIPDFAATGSHPMSLLQRMRAFLSMSQGYERDQWFNVAMENLYRTRFNLETVPSFLELERNASLVFINSHHSTDFARALPPMFVNVGGMQCWDPIGKLPQDLQEYMDGAEDGVILISFGSTIDLSTLSDFYLNIFFNTMRKFSRVRFLWRWSGPMPEGHADNVMASKWLPQREILNHPKVIGFMTHCGLNSVNEATFAGVPLIALPLFADQDLTAYRIQAQKIGLRLEARDFSQEMLDSAMEEIIYNPIYKKNMMMRAEIFKDRPRNPIEESIFWTEFVLRHDDTSALKPMLIEQSFWTRTMLDAYMAIFALFALVPIVLLAVLLKGFNHLYRPVAARK